MHHAPSLQLLLLAYLKSRILLRTVGAGPLHGPRVLRGTNLAS
jgi:hypothetical protein